MPAVVRHVLKLAEVLNVLLLGHLAELTCTPSSSRAADSGSQKMQRTCETPSCAHLDNASTKEVLQKNSTDSCMGRRPMYKSDEFFQSTSLVDQIFLILLRSVAHKPYGLFHVCYSLLLVFLIIILISASRTGTPSRLWRRVAWCATW